MKRVAAGETQARILSCGHRQPGSLRFKGTRKWASDSLAFLAIRLAESKTIDDRALFHIQSRLRLYAKKRLDEEQSALAHAALYSYSQMLRAEAQMESLTMGSPEYQRTSTSYIAHCGNFKAMSKLAGLNKPAKKQERSPQSMWKRAPSNHEAEANRAEADEEP